MIAPYSFPLFLRASPPRQTYDKVVAAVPVRRSRAFLAVLGDKLCGRDLAAEPNTRWNISFLGHSVIASKHWGQERSQRHQGKHCLSHCR